MKIKTHGNKMIITKSINDYLDEKLKRLDKYFESENTANVNVSIKNAEHKIEISVVTNFFTIRAEECSKDLYKSIDLVIDKLERQITKNKSKIQKKYSKTPNFDMTFEIEEEVEEEVLDIVKRKNMTTKPMDEEEAMLQMNLINHDFFVFKNINEECVSVIYKRKDNKYGIINIK